MWKWGFSLKFCLELGKGFRKILLSLKFCQMYNTIIRMRRITINILRHKSVKIVENHAKYSKITSFDHSLNKKIFLKSQVGLLSKTIVSGTWLLNEKLVPWGIITVQTNPNITAVSGHNLIIALR